MSAGLTEQADVRWKRANAAKTLLKKRKRRLERRKSNQQPDTQPTYGKYSGYQS
jgi:DNA replication protein DnaD